MQVQVVRMRRKGLRLRASECDPPEQGELRVRFEDSLRAGYPPRRVARLFRIEGVTPMERHLLTLFDPRLIRFERNLLTLAGIELSGTYENEPRVQEFVQVWRCKLLGSVPQARRLQEWPMETVDKPSR